MEARSEAYSGDRSLQHRIEPRAQKRDKEVERPGYKAEPPLPRPPLHDHQRKKAKEVEKPEVKRRAYTGSHGVDKAEPVTGYQGKAGASSPPRARPPLHDHQRKKAKEAEKPEVKQRGYTGSHGVDKVEPVTGYQGKAGASSRPRARPPLHDHQWKKAKEAEKPEVKRRAYTGSHGVDKAEPVTGYQGKAGASSTPRARPPLHDHQRKKDKEAEKPEIKPRGYTGSHGVDKVEPVTGYPAKAGASSPPPIQGYQSLPPAYSQDIGPYPSPYPQVCYHPNQGCHQPFPPTYSQDYLLPPNPGYQPYPLPPNPGYPGYQPYPLPPNPGYPGYQPYPLPPNPGYQPHPLPPTYFLPPPNQGYQPYAPTYSGPPNCWGAVASAVASGVASALAGAVVNAVLTSS